MILHGRYHVEENEDARRRNPRRGKLSTAVGVQDGAQCFEEGHLDGHRPRELHPRRDHQAGIGGLAAAAIGSVKIVDSGVDERTPAVGAVDVTRRGGAG